MSWLRIEGRMPQHHKVAPLSDAAFRLHITAMAWSVEGKTDGRVPRAIPATLTRAPVGKKLKDALQELTDTGVWVLTKDGFEIHDFLQWNLSAADIAARSDAKARAGASGGRRSGEARAKQSPSTSEAAASPVLQVAAKLVEAKPKPLSQSLPKSLSQSEEDADPAAPSPDRIAELNRDRFPMHNSWVLLEENLAAIEIAGVPRWAIFELIARFRAHFIADPSDISSHSEWVQRCTKWVLKDWRNPKNKPEKPVAATADEEREARTQQRLAHEAERQRREIEADTERARALLAGKGNPDAPPALPDFKRLAQEIG